MTEWKEVTGSQTERPSEIDTESSPTTVFQRRNITTTVVDNENGTQTHYWKYEERKMSKDEFIKFQQQEINQAKADIDFLSAMTGIEL